MTKKLFLFFILFILSIYSFSKSSNNILNKKINEFKVENITMGDCIKKIAEEYKIILGFEEIEYTLSNNKGKKNISINLKNITVKNLLNELVKVNNEYFWEESNGIIVIMPKSNNIKDKYEKSVLNDKIKSLSINNENIYHAIWKIEEILNESSKWTFGVGIISGIFPWEADNIKKLSLNFKNVTVRDALNSLVREDGNFYWYLEGKKYGNKRVLQLGTFIKVWIKK